MKIKCEICGCNNFKKGEQDFLCTNCGMTYSKEQIVSMIEKVDEEEKIQKALEEQRIAEEKIRIAKEKEEEKIRIAKEKEEEKIKRKKAREEKRIQRKKDKAEKKIRKRELRKKILSYCKKKKIASKLLLCILLIAITITLINYSKRAPISFLKLGKKISTETVEIGPSSDYTSSALIARFCPKFELADCYEYYYNTTREYEKENDKVTAQGLNAPRRLVWEFDEIKNDYVTTQTPEISIINIKSSFFQKKYFSYSKNIFSEHNFLAWSILGYMYDGNEGISEKSGVDGSVSYTNYFYSSPLLDNEAITNFLGLEKIDKMFPLSIKSDIYIEWLPSYISMYVKNNGYTFTSIIEKHTKYTLVKIDIAECKMTLYINNETNELEYNETKTSEYRVIHKKSNKYEYLLKENDRLIKKYKKQVEIYNYEIKRKYSYN